MPTAQEIEVYTQRYETYRHLDKLRWQMLQIAVAAAPLSLALGRNADAHPQPWAYAVVGLVLIVLGFVMERIRHGITENNRVLREAAAAVGDQFIPSPSSWRRSYSAWIAYALIALGILSFSAQFWGG